MPETTVEEAKTPLKVSDIIRKIKKPGQTKRAPQIYIPTGGKVGAPKLPVEAKRSVQMFVQVASEDLAEYEAYAKQAQLGLAVLIRLAVLRYMEKGDLPPEAVAVLKKQRKGFLPPVRKLLVFTPAEAEGVKAFLAQNKIQFAPFARYAFEKHLAEHP